MDRENVHLKTISHYCFWNLKISKCADFPYYFLGPRTLRTALHARLNKQARESEYCFFKTEQKKARVAAAHGAAQGGCAAARRLLLQRGDLGLRPPVFATQPPDHRVESEAGLGRLNDRPHRVHVRVGQVSGDIANPPTVTQRLCRPLLGVETSEQCGEFNALIIDAAPDLIGVHRCQSESAIPGAVLDTCTKNS